MALHATSKYLNLGTACGYAREVYYLVRITFTYYLVRIRVFNFETTKFYIINYHS
eukprot:SAG31_NODE_8343_length_1470_cov_0.854850_2_plen_55_part_00